MLIQARPDGKEQAEEAESANGPALVFAVAGAGKTTAMVHRIQRLVAERRCPRRKSWPPPLLTPMCAIYSGHQPHGRPAGR